MEVTIAENYVCIVFASSFIINYYQHIIQYTSSILNDWGDNANFYSKLISDGGEFQSDLHLHDSILSY